MNITLHRKCGCEKPCGCQDDVFTTKSTCSLPPECFNPEQCSETFSSECIVYTGDNIADLGIIKGARMTDVIQILINAIVNPGCTLPTAPCLSVVGFKSTIINQTTATFVWTPITGALNYQIEYKLVPSLTWTVGTATTNSYDTIGGLNPNTQYYVRVSTNCGTSSCFSLTLLITTKP